MSPRWHQKRRNTSWKVSLCPFISEFQFAAHTPCLVRPRPPPGPAGLQALLDTCCSRAELCYDICEHDPLCVGEQQFFDRVFGLIRSAAEP